MERQEREPNTYPRFNTYYPPVEMSKRDMNTLLVSPQKSTISAVI
jgi:hypothetical protein